MKKIFKSFLFMLFLSASSLAEQQTFFTTLDRAPVFDPYFADLKQKEITLPDLHGNALKLLSALMATNIIQLDQKQYAIFAKIYLKEAPDVSLKDLTDFKDMLLKISLNEKNRNTLVRLIGDEFCDRGSNDLWTILLLRRLQHLGLKMEFIISNHSFEFVESVEVGNFMPKRIDGPYARSLLGLKHLMLRKIINVDEVKKIAEEFYKNNLKVISYTALRHANTMVIYTHAPVGLKDIKKLAVDLGVPYKDRTMQDLETTIDAINSAYSTHIKKGISHKLFYALENFLWNRDCEDLERPSLYHDYALQFVHGHDPEAPSSGHIFNLDHNNHLGKTLWDMEGYHQIFSVS